jgi:hypothetical protein
MSAPTAARPSHVAGVVAAVVTLLAFAAWSFADSRSLHRACVEDGLVESATAIGFLVAAIAFLLASRRAREPRIPGSLGRRTLACGAVLMAIFCGEEISWGQRIFGFATPACLRELNRQGEFNVHNLGELQRLKYSFLIALVGALGVGLPLLRGVGPVRRFVERHGLSWPSAAAVALLVGAILYLRHGTAWLPTSNRNDAQEIGELCFALGMAAFGLNSAAMLARPVERIARPVLPIARPGPAVPATAPALAARPSSRPAPVRSAGAPALR